MNAEYFIASFLEPTGYRSVSAYEAANEKRAKAQVRNKERQIEAIKAKAGIVEHNVIDATSNPGRLKAVQEDWVGAIETPLKPVDFEPAQTALAISISCLCIRCPVSRRRWIRCFHKSRRMRGKQTMKQPSVRRERFHRFQGGRRP